MSGQRGGGTRGRGGGPPRGNTQQRSYPASYQHYEAEAALPLGSHVESGKEGLGWAPPPSLSQGGSFSATATALGWAPPPVTSATSERGGHGGGRHEPGARDSGAPRATAPHVTGGGWPAPGNPYTFGGPSHPAVHPASAAVDAGWGDSPGLSPTSIDTAAVAHQLHLQHAAETAALFEKQRTELEQILRSDAAAAAAVAAAAAAAASQRAVPMSAAAQAIWAQALPFQPAPSLAQAAPLAAPPPLLQPPQFGRAAPEAFPASPLGGAGDPVASTVPLMADPAVLAFARFQGADDAPALDPTTFGAFYSAPPGFGAAPVAAAAAAAESAAPEGGLGGGEEEAGEDDEDEWIRQSLQGIQQLATAPDPLELAASQRVPFPPPAPAQTRWGGAAPAALPPAPAPAPAPPSFASALRAATDARPSPAAAPAAAGVAPARGAPPVAAGGGRPAPVPAAAPPPPPVPVPAPAPARGGSGPARGGKAKGRGRGGGVAGASGGRSSAGGHGGGVLPAGMHDPHAALPSLPPTAAVGAALQASLADPDAEFVAQMEAAIAESIAAEEQAKREREERGRAFRDRDQYEQGYGDYAVAAAFMTPDAAAAPAAAPLPPGVQVDADGWEVLPADLDAALGAPTSAYSSDYYDGAIPESLDSAVSAAAIEAALGPAGPRQKSEKKLRKLREKEEAAAAAAAAAADAQAAAEARAREEAAEAAQAASDAAAAAAAAAASGGGAAAGGGGKGKKKGGKKGGQGGPASAAAPAAAAPAPPAAPTRVCYSEMPQAAFLDTIPGCASAGAGLHSAGCFEEAGAKFREAIKRMIADERVRAKQASLLGHRQAPAAARRAVAAARDDDEEDPTSGAGDGSPAPSAAPAALEPPDWALPRVGIEIPALHQNTLSVGLLHAARALSLERHGRLEEALGATEAGILAEPGCLPALVRATRLHIILGDIQAAHTCASKALSALAEMPTNASASAEDTVDDEVPAAACDLSESDVHSFPPPAFVALAAKALGELTSYLVDLETAANEALNRNINETAIQAYDEALRRLSTPAVSDLLGLGIGTSCEVPAALSLLRCRALAAKVDEEGVMREAMERLPPSLGGINGTWGGDRVPVTLQLIAVACAAAEFRLEKIKAAQQRLGLIAALKRSHENGRRAADALRAQIFAYENGMSKGAIAAKEGHWFVAVRAYTEVLGVLSDMVPAPTRLQASALAQRASSRSTGLDEHAAAYADCARALYLCEQHNVARLCRARTLFAAAASGKIDDFVGKTIASLEEEGIGDFTAVLTSVAARQASIGLGGRVKDTRAELEAELEKTKRDIAARRKDREVKAKAAAAAARRKAEEAQTKANAELRRQEAAAARAAAAREAAAASRYAAGDDDEDEEEGDEEEEAGEGDADEEDWEEAEEDAAPPIPSPGASGRAASGAGAGMRGGGGGLPPGFERAFFEHVFGIPGGAGNFFFYGGGGGGRGRGGGFPFGGGIFGDDGDDDDGSSGRHPAEQPTDHYGILGVEHNTPQSEIRRVYRAASLALHPDKTGGDEAKNERFKAISVSYNAVASPELREKHDEEVHDFKRAYPGKWKPASAAV